MPLHIDNGKEGDVKPNDGIYMLDFIIPPTAISGEINIPVTVKDRIGDKASGGIDINQVKRMKLFLKIVVFLILLSTAAHALPENYGISVFESKMGARTFGMGGAFAFVGGDKTASFSNPAGLLGSQGIFLSVQGSTLGIVQIFSVGSGTAGLGLVAKNMRDIPVGGSLYSYSNEYAVLLYAQKISRFMLGATLKSILNQQLRTGSSSRTGLGWDVDIGLLTAPLPWMKIGALVQNALPSGFLGGGSNAWSDTSVEEIPPVLRVGSGVKVFGKKSLFSNVDIGDLLVGLDVEMDVHGTKPSLIHAGFEWRRGDDSFSFRAGLDQQMRNNAVESLFTFGMGTVLEAWNLDGFCSASTSSSSAGLSAFYSPLEETRKKTEKARSLEVIHPGDNVVTTDEKIIVSGEASGLNVKINELDVFVEVDGRFSAEVPLHVGKNLIQIVGAYEDGEKVVKRHILRNARVIIKEAVVLEKEREKIRKEQKKILQRELAIALLEKKPSISAKETEAIKKEKRKLELEKARLEEKANKIDIKKKTMTVQKEKVETLATLGVIRVEDKKEYETRERISRAELAMWLVKARGFSAMAVQRDLFPDVRSSYWAASYIQTAVQKGLMRPYTDGTFRPEDGVGETEAIDILKKFDELR